MQWEIDETERVRLLGGKYAGQYVHNLPDSYLRWIVNDHAEKGTWDEDLIELIEAELGWRDSSGTKIADY